MKANLIAIFCLAALVIAANATVFEAETSEDVDLFLQDFENETVGFLFYDSDIDNAKDEDWFAKLSSKILGIFMSRDQIGRSTEDWVELFDDKLHLMRVDVRKPENMRAKEEFNIEFAPYIVLKDKTRTVLREKIDDETYDHVRMLLDRRPNLLHKTGGAALKSFNLEPDAEAPETAPRVIQYFDLEEGEPTNVEPPVQTQYVNWAPVDVIGPDGNWEQRGRNWVTSYEIPESGIKGQEDAKKAHIQKRINDDPRGKPGPKPAPKPTPKPALTKKPAPAQKVTQKPAATTKKAIKPGQAPRKETRAFENARTDGYVQGRLGSLPSRPTPNYISRKNSLPQGPSGVKRNTNGMPTRHPYHSSQYEGYGEYGSSARSYY